MKVLVSHRGVQQGTDMAPFRSAHMALMLALSIFAIAGAYFAIVYLIAH